MPLYDLLCDCGHTEERFLKLNETEPECSTCGRQMKKVMSAPAFILKGSGWYKDGYGSKPTKNNGGGKKDA